MSVIIPERLEAVKDIPLSVGSHPAPKDGEIPCAFCAEEKWTYMTGLPWGDHPENKSEVIAAFVRTFQDNADQATRDAIDVWQIENADRLAATANDEHEQTRGFLAADWSARVALPLWLEVAGATDAAATLRARPAIGSRADAGELRAAIEQIRSDLKYPSWSVLREDLRRRVREAVRKALDEKKGAAGAAEAVEAAWAVGAAWAVEAVEAVEAAEAAEAAWAAEAAGAAGAAWAVEAVEAAWAVEAVEAVEAAWAVGAVEAVEAAEAAEAAWAVEAAGAAWAAGAVEAAGAAGAVEAVEAVEAAEAAGAVEAVEAAGAAGAAEAAEAAEARKLIRETVRAKILEAWGERFAPTTTQIKASAIELLEAMVAVGEKAAA